MLVQPLNKVLNTIKLINEGKDLDAIASLGLKYKKDRKLQGSFLERALELSTTLNESNSHSGGVLVTPDSKVFNSKDLLSENMDVNYMLTEDVSMLTANSISSMTLLTEGYDSIIDNNGFNNIRKTLKEGLGIMEESLTNVFNTTSNIIKKSFSVLNESSSNSKYSKLIDNAFIGANTLVNIKKAKDFTDNNTKLISEAHTTYNIKNDPDTVLYGTLDLQEKLIRSFMDLNKFNNSFITRLNESKDINDINDYMIGAIEQVVTPLSEGTITFKTNTFNKSINNSIEAIVSLYDEYIQDYVA